MAVQTMNIWTVSQFQNTKPLFSALCNVYVSVYLGYGCRKLLETSQTLNTVLTVCEHSFSFFRFIYTYYFL